MATKYKMARKKDMRKGAEPDSKLYYAVSSSNGMCTFDELCNTIADRSCATPGDVKLVLDGFIFVINQQLEKGMTIQLGDLGYFSVVIGSKGVEKPEDFNTSMIKRKRIVFRPGKKLAETAKNLKVERVGKVETTPPVTPPDEGGDDVLE